MGCILFFCLTSCDYISAVRDSEVAAQVSLGATVIQQSDCSVDFNFRMVTYPQVFVLVC